MWSQRFAAERVAGLYSRHRGQASLRHTPQTEARILEATRRAPADGATPWSTRKLAAQLGVSHMRVARVWAKHGIKLHRLERDMASTDPAFEQKAATSSVCIRIRLSTRPCSAWMRKRPFRPWTAKLRCLPLSPGRAERQGFEYDRHGTLSLDAAFNTTTGEVLGQTADRYTSEQFVAFLTDLVAAQPPGKEIHVIANDLSAHKTSRGSEFLPAHSNGHLHFTPTYSSWLKQVELWVRQDRARCHRTGRLHLGKGPQQEPAARYSSLP